MKKSILVLSLALFMFCLLGCNLSIDGKNSHEEFPFIEYQYHCNVRIVYDKNTKVVYYYSNNHSSAILTPYYLPDGTIAVYGKNFPYKGETNE